MVHFQPLRRPSPLSVEQFRHRPPFLPPRTRTWSADRQHAPAVTSAPSPSGSSTASDAFGAPGSQLLSPQGIIMTSSESDTTETATRASATPPHRASRRSAAPRYRRNLGIAEGAATRSAWRICPQMNSRFSTPAAGFSQPPEGRKRVRRIRAAQLRLEALLIHVAIWPAKLSASPYSRQD